MIVFVTGGTGFVGTKIVHALRARGHEVRALVRKPRHAATLQAWGCELVEGDVSDADALQRGVAGADVVVHLVAIIKGRPADFHEVMEQPTRKLVAAAEQADVGRFLLMSALGTSEQNRHLVPYYHARWEMEAAVRACALEAVIFRPSLVFGRDGGVLPMFLRQTRWSPVTPVVGTGTERLQPIWVDDVAAYFAEAVALDGAEGKTFELGGPDVVTWNELHDRIRRVLGKRRATLHLPVGLVRAGATVSERLPGAPITRDQLTMLVEGGDQVCDTTPALTTFSVRPIGLDEQIRRAA